ncbi:MAG: pantoate--beta-alanine ligase [Gammaproteobacteria bacterium]|nr:pantoate--beta-alanine ligase [Gammaproteobacteria bacterium]MDA7970915.1 pantoate--beta-alanine ligase [Gammaproteobacteria bacterium]MDA7971384.1 pantoate--beta-alanine ligase [Gammaproteobacteria bacterium]MDA7996258.1 pantoate--beta-alanine ligase [Gammaproteobacteria bacterium]
MIKSLPSPQSAARWCARARADGRTLGYVPTMGALHRGHLSLVERAVRENDVVCASIFVNPLQFNDPEDLKKYPRDKARDLELLERASCAMVFGGELAQFFPGADPRKLPPRDAGVFARGLEGAHRPGHLPGVRAIVERLFATVGACAAYFGEKDFQQCLVVRDIAAQLDSVRVVLCPTVREKSGLAMSSRNRRLGAEDLRAAEKLHRALQAARAAWRDGERDPAAFSELMHAQLRDARIRVEYAEVRDAARWSENAPQTLRGAKHARALIAAHIGGVRLIDNIALDENAAELPATSTEPCRAEAPPSRNAV